MYRLESLYYICFEVSFSFSLNSAIAWKRAPVKYIYPYIAVSNIIPVRYFINKNFIFNVIYSCILRNNSYAANIIYFLTLWHNKYINNNYMIILRRFVKYGFGREKKNTLRPNKVRCIIFFFHIFNRYKSWYEQFSRQCVIPRHTQY